VATILVALRDDMKISPLLCLGHMVKPLDHVI
jgi:hypothetical protein